MTAISLLLIGLAALTTYGFMTINLAYIIGGTFMLLMLVGLAVIDDIGNHRKGVK